MEGFEVLSSVAAATLITPSTLEEARSWPTPICCRQRWPYAASDLCRESGRNTLAGPAKRQRPHAGRCPAHDQDGSRRLGPRTVAGSSATGFRHCSESRTLEPPLTCGYSARPLRGTLRVVAVSAAAPPVEGPMRPACPPQRSTGVAARRRRVVASTHPAAVPAGPRCVNLWSRSSAPCTPARPQSQQHPGRFTGSPPG